MDSGADFNGIIPAQNPGADGFRFYADLPYPDTGFGTGGSGLITGHVTWPDALGLHPIGSMSLATIEIQGCSGGSRLYLMNYDGTNKSCYDWSSPAAQSAPYLFDVAVADSGNNLITPLPRSTNERCGRGSESDRRELLPKMSARHY